MFDRFPPDFSIDLNRFSMIGRRIGGGLEEDGKRIGGGLEEDWRNGGELEEDWRRIGGGCVH